MASKELSDQQWRFIKKYLKSVGLVNRSKNKEYNNALIEAYENFVKRVTKLRAAALGLSEALMGESARAQINLAEEIVGRNDKAPDIAGGHAQLDQVEIIISADVLAGIWNTRSAEVQPLVEPAKKQLIAQRAEIDTAWTESNTLAERGKITWDKTTLKLAIQRLDQIKALIKTGSAEQAMLKKLFENPAEGEGVGNAVALSAASTAVTIQKQRYEAVVARLGESFKPSLPAELTVITDEIDVILGAIDPKDADKMNADAAILTQKIDKLEADSGPHLAALAKWQADLVPVVARLDTLKNHALANDAAQIKPLVDDIQNDVSVAQSKADEQKYSDASALLVGLLDKCNLAIKTADDKAKYAAIKKDRAERITDLPAVDGDTHATVSALINKATTAKNEADAAATSVPPDFTTATEKLKDIPADVNEAKRLDDLIRELVSDIVALNTWAPDWEQFHANHAPDTPLDPDLGVFKTSVQKVEADLAGGRIEEAVMRSNSLWSYKDAIDTRQKHAEAYYTALAEFNIRLAKFVGKPGHEAVEGYIARMNADKVAADTAVARKDYYVAKSVLQSSADRETEMLAQLALGVAFFPKYKAVGDALDAIRGSNDGSTAPDPNSAKAAAIVADAAKLYADAYAAGVSKRDWPTATSLIDAAKARVDEATHLLQSVAFVEAEKADGALADAANNFDPAFAIYEKIRERAASDDPGAFASKITEANAKAQEARVASGVDPVVPGDVNGALNAAIAICETVIDLSAKKKAYDAVYQAAKNQHDTQVKPLDTAENKITDHVKKIETLLEEATDLAKPDGFNFDAASAKVDEALAIANAVPALVQQRADLKAKMEKVVSLTNELEGPDYKPGCQAEIDRLKQVKSDYDAADAAFDLAKMKIQAETGDKLRKPIIAIAKKYREFVNVGFENLAKTYWDAIKDLAPDLSDNEFFERVSTKKHFDDFLAFKDKHNYTAAIKTYPPIAWASKKGVEVAKGWEVYKPAKKDARTSIDGLKPNAEDKAHIAAIAALEIEFTGAEGWATKRFDYIKAKDLMRHIEAKADGLAAPIGIFNTFVAKKGEVETSIDALTELDKSGGVEPVIKRATGKHANAVKLAEAGDLKGAMALLAEALAEIDAAKPEANAINDFVGDTEKLGTDAAAEDADLGALLDGATAQVTQLVRESDGIGAMPRLVELADMLSDAKAGLPAGEDEARAAVIEAVAECIAIRKEMAHVAQTLREIEAATKLINPLVVSHPQSGFVAAEAQALLDKLTNARHSIRADAQKVDDGLRDLEEARAAYFPLKAAADAHIDYVKLRDEVSPLIEAMEKHPQRFTIQKEMIDFREKLAKAAEKATEKKHAEAMGLLREAKAIQIGALLTAKMEGGEEPTKEDIFEILSGPTGTADLDKIINGLDPKASRRVLRVAIEARFGCELKMEKPNAAGTDLVEDQDQTDTGEDIKGPNMRALYEAMSKLPPSDTLGNESLLGVTRVSEADEASDYWGDNKVMTMREGEMMNSPAYGIGLEFELELEGENAVLPEHRPLPGETVRMFSWNTLHEVGHAVDDKLNFSNRKSKALAGWENHQRNVSGIAAKVAGKFKYDEDYVARLMITRKVDPPEDPTAAPLPDPGIPANPDPSTIAPDEWERRRMLVNAWVQNMFSDRSPWQTTAAAKMCEIDGVCHHESQAGEWVSYPMAARKQGVSGYQFRSPLEWFSELYAAYHSKKLPDTHPAVSWLAELKNPTEV